MLFHVRLFRLWSLLLFLLTFRAILVLRMLVLSMGMMVAPPSTQLLHTIRCRIVLHRNDTRNVYHLYQCFLCEIDCDCSFVDYYFMRGIDEDETNVRIML